MVLVRGINSDVQENFCAEDSNLDIFTLNHLNQSKGIVEICDQFIIMSSRKTQQLLKQLLVHLQSKFSSKKKVFLFKVKLLVLDVLFHFQCSQFFQ